MEALRALAPPTATSEAGGLTDHDSGTSYGAEEISVILGERDRFIVAKGLWEEFVSSLPVTRKP